MNNTEKTIQFLAMFVSAIPIILLIILALMYDDEKQIYEIKNELHAEMDTDTNVTNSESMSMSESEVEKVALIEKLEQKLSFKKTIRSCFIIFAISTVILILSKLEESE